MRRSINNVHHPDVASGVKILEYWRRGKHACARILYPMQELVRGPTVGFMHMHVLCPRKAPSPPRRLVLILLPPMYISPGARAALHPERRLVPQDKDRHRVGPSRALLVHRHLKVPQELCSNKAHLGVRQTTPSCQLYAHSQNGNWETECSLLANAVPRPGRE